MISPFVPVLVGGLLAAGCLWGAFYSFRRKRLIDDTPTSKTQGVFIGVAELKGSAESEQPFAGFLSGLPSVWNSWEAQEHWQRTVTETYRDAQGHMQTRTRTESGWKKVAGGGDSAPFYLKDESGLLRISPEGAKIQSKTTFDQTVRPDSELYYAKGPAEAISNSTHQRRFTETAIPLHAQLYVLGQARVRDDIAAAEIACDKKCPFFLISLKSEKQISSGYNWVIWAFSLAGLAVAVGAAAGWGATQFPAAVFRPVAFIAAAGIYALAGGLLWTWEVFNSLINLHHRVEQAWSQVDVQLKRRHDLIPNLVEAVQGYATHERDTQALLARMRSQLEATPPGVSGPDFLGLATMLRITVEKYPDLKASDNFLKLQASLADTEERIALARDYYNDVTTFYNTRLSIVPERFVAALARLKPAALMAAAGFERAPVKVDLQP